MKLPLFLGAVFIYLVSLFAVMPAQAEILECNSTTLVEIMQGEEECPTSCIGSV